MTAAIHNPTECLLSYDDAGKMLGVTGRTVYSLVKSGELPAVRFGRSVRIDPADLREFIDKSKRVDTIREAGE